jgi:hypothetical protein
MGQWTMAKIMNATDRNDNATLFWPIKERAALGIDSDLPLDQIQGYVIGWELKDGILTRDDQHIITICAGIVPSALLAVQGANEQNTNGDSSCLYSYSQVQDALTQLSSLSELYSDLRVVARWGVKEKVKDIQSSQKTDEGFIPTLTVTPDGPWWLGESSSTRNIPTPTTANTTSQLVYFEPCPHSNQLRQSLDHYQHYTLGADLHSERTNMNNMLDLISETETVMHYMSQILKGIQINRGDIRTTISVEKRKDDELSSRHERTSVEPSHSKFGQLAMSLEPFLFVIRQVKNTATLRSLDNQESSPVAQLPLFYLLHRYFHENTSSFQHELFLPRCLKSERCRQRDNVRIHAFIDGFLGLLLGILLVQYSSEITEFVSAHWRLTHGSTIQNVIDWLERFPVGFKLNVPLTKVMGGLIVGIFEGHELILQLSLSSIATLSRAMADDFSIVTGLGVFSSLFGVSLTLSLFYDMTAIATFRFYCISRIFLSILSTELSTFSSLWHLFRGKKINILRKRSDTLEYDFMQLLLGMILFAICLFLFTTILVYCAVFTGLQLAISCSIMVVGAVDVMLNRFPFGDVVSATKSSNTAPGRFCKSICFSYPKFGLEDMKLKCNFSRETSTTYDFPGPNVCVLEPVGLNRGSVLRNALTEQCSYFLAKFPTYIKSIVTDPFHRAPKLR